MKKVGRKSKRFFLPAFCFKKMNHRAHPAKQVFHNVINFLKNIIYQYAMEKRMNQIIFSKKNKKIVVEKEKPAD